MYYFPEHFCPVCHKHTEEAMGFGKYGVGKIYVCPDNHGRFEYIPPISGYICCSVCGATPVFYGGNIATCPNGHGPCGGGDEWVWVSTPQTQAATPKNENSSSERDAYGNEYYESGELKYDQQGNEYYKNGELKRDTDGNEYYESGDLKRDPFGNSWDLYYENGTVKCEPDGTEYYEDGSLKRESDGTEYYENGSLKREPDGTEYYEDGSLKDTDGNEY